MVIWSTQHFSVSSIRGSLLGNHCGPLKPLMGSKPTYITSIFQAAQSAGRVNDKTEALISKYAEKRLFNNLKDRISKKKAKG